MFSIDQRLVSRMKYITER